MITPQLFLCLFAAVQLWEVKQEKCIGGGKKHDPTFKSLFSCMWAPELLIAGLLLYLCAGGLDYFKKHVIWRKYI